jgi:hypothetical protein
VVFIGSTEMALGMVRRLRAGAAAASEEQRTGDEEPNMVTAANGTAADHRQGTVTVDNVARHFETLLQAGQAPTARAIQREMHVGQRTADRLRKQLTAQ